jgi:hypothetical protein
MKKIILISSILLLGCDASETVVKKTSSDINSNDLTAESKNESTAIVPNDSNSIQSNNKNTEILEPSDAQGYSAQRSLNSILSLDDPREVVYLVHPTKEMLVYCYHDLESECYIEGVHNSQFFKYDISQVEGQNMGKLTFHTHDIESSKTTPTEWMTINDKYVQVLMTSKIMLNSKQHTLYEPLVIDYEAGMMVR